MLILKLFEEDFSSFKRPSLCFLEKFLCIFGNQFCKIQFFSHDLRIFFHFSYGDPNSIFSIRPFLANRCGIFDTFGEVSCYHFDVSY